MSWTISVIGLRAGSSTRSLDQTFQPAAVTLMREFCFEHIEPYLVGELSIPFRRDKLEPCIRIDAAAGKPGACYSRLIPNGCAIEAPQSCPRVGLDLTTSI